MDAAGILIIAVCGAIGIYIRYEARESRRPWLLTVVLAAVFLALSLLKPPGQELFAILCGITGGLAAGILIIAVCGARRSHKKKDARVQWTRALFS